jgi:hypothetical protein
MGLFNVKLATARCQLQLNVLIVEQQYSQMRHSAVSAVITYVFTLLLLQQPQSHQLLLLIFLYKYRRLLLIQSWNY